MLDFYAANTANGYKVAIVLEETDTPYRLHAVDLVKGEQFTPEFQAISRAGRIPAISVSGQDAPFVLYGSEAIGIYLAETSGQFLSSAYPARARVLELCGIASSDMSLPMAVQFQVAYLLPGEHPEVLDFFIKQGRRMFEVLDRTVSTQPYMAGDDYSLADMLAFPAVAMSAPRIPGILDGLDALTDWRGRIGAREAVERAMALKLD